MDAKRDLRSPSPDSGSDTEGPPTPRASRSKPPKASKPAGSSSAKTVTIADSLASLDKRQHLSLYGSRGYDTETALKNQDSIRKEDAEYFADRDPQKALDKMERREAKIEFQKRLFSDHAKSPFCCHKLVHVERDGSGEFMEEGRRDPILKFVKNIETAEFADGVDRLSDEDLKGIKELYRVNRTKDPHNKATFIYAPVPHNGSEAYISIFKIDPPHAFERFGGPRTGGKNGYLAFTCPVHKCSYQVGYSVYHMIGKNGTVATFGDGRLDKLMKVERLERLVLGYGGVGF
ncbi:hypothetical protein BKA64DRAFT_726256 [Cadophora sp. MPI-SDFR-AT-0126]|nr:hypothetical protein BKA64DRAFT_726256 [Leotiomycetes sp. MPI-SDFR-AT-0126]